MSREQTTVALPKELPDEVIASVVGGGLTSDQVRNVHRLLFASLSLREPEAPTVSGGEGWEDKLYRLQKLVSYYDGFSDDEPFSESFSLKEGELLLTVGDLRALIAVARGGFSALQASPSVPTVQAETAVVGRKERSRLEVAVWEFLSDWRKGDFELPTLAALDAEAIETALVAQLSPVSTGEQPGMSEANETNLAAKQGGKSHD